MSECIWKAAKQTLPNKKTKSKKIIKEQQGKEEIIAYKQMQLIRKLIARVKRRDITNNLLPQDINFINYKIKELQAEVDIQIPNLPEIIENINIDIWVKEMWSIWKTIFKSKQIAQQTYIRNKIDQAIDERCRNMELDPRRMINSILERNRKPLIIDKIIDDGNSNPIMITEPEEILKKTKKYFEKSAQQRSQDRVEFIRVWSEQYQPKKEIDKNWYDQIMKQIGREELMETLTKCNNQKAAGES
ncbi:1184_t:CDS:1, partial [Entrophospora sp. SA101]